MTKEIQEIDLIRATYRKYIIGKLASIRNTPFNVSIGRMYQDGIIYPSTEPRLVLKAAKTVGHTSVLPTIYFQIDTLLGIPLEEMKNYYVDLWVNDTEPGGAIVSDDVKVYLDNAAGNDYIAKVEITDPSDLSNGRTGIPSIRFYPDATHGSIFVEAELWTSGVDNFRAVILVYKLPDSIC